MTNHEITTAIGTDGLGEQSWWVQQWMELINSYRYKKRLERAWNYAREGNVQSIRFEGRRVHGRVQGTEKQPYKIKIWLDVLEDEDWSYVIDSLAKKAKWSAQLLAGVMPNDIEDAFASTGKRLFPFNLQEVKSECSCPDKANPCKHISAIYFLMGEQFKEDPFILFQLRGRNKNKLLSDLTKKRIDINKENSKITKLEQEISNNPNHTITNNSFVNCPEQWWTYKYNLDDDLVVITTSSEENTGPFLAGELPLAKDPKFPESQQTFIKNLLSHCRVQGEKAMLEAMVINDKSKKMQ